MVPMPLKVTSFDPVSRKVRKEVETNSKFSIESRYLKCPLGVRSTLMVKLRTLPSMLPPPVTFIAGPLGGGGGGGGGGGAVAQEPIVNCVPPRAMSLFAFTLDMKVCPRNPASVEPFAMGGPWVAKGLSLLSETFTVIFLLTVSNAPLSALPWVV